MIRLPPVSMLELRIVAIGWGLLLAWPLVARARRVAVGHRVRSLGAPERPLPWGPARRGTGLVAAAVTRLGDTVARTGLGRMLRARCEQARRRRADLRVAAALPVTLDLLSVALDAGCTPRLALDVGGTWAPSETAAPLRSACAATAVGAGLDAALGRAVDAMPTLAPLAELFVAHSRLGAPLAPALSRLAGEARSEQRRRAEARARALPVKLLFPLVFLVLPAFGLLTVAPTLLRALARL